MLRFRLETVPHALQRYDTVGDWYVEAGGTVVIRVSDLGNWKQEILVALHELVEYALCVDHDVTAKQVDAFDMGWKPHHGIQEPGDDLMAPYYTEHQFASGIERLMAAELGVVWTEYERVVNAQSQGECHGERATDRAGDPGQGPHGTAGHATAD